MKLRSFVRDNSSDEKVLHDLAVLAGEEVPDDVDGASGEGAVGPADEGRAFAERLGLEFEDDEANPFADGFTRRFVQTSIHLKRYFPFYVGAALWLFVILFIQPLGSARDVTPGLAAAPGASTTSGLAQNAADVAAPGVAASPALDFGDTTATFDDGTAFTTSESEFASDSSAQGSSDFSFDDSSLSTDTTASDEPLPPTPLQISKSGYSSRTAGTPLEVAPPQNGLPVAAAAGEAVKRSFIAVTGTEFVLRLRLVEDPSNAGVEAAVVKACPIETEDWEGARGQSFADEPAFVDPCVTGQRGADGVFSFDLGDYGDPASLPGFALTPAPGTSTFNLTFAPVAVTAE